MLKNTYNRTPVHRAVPVSQINLQIRELFNYTANYRDFEEIVKGAESGETEVFINIKRFLSQNSVEIFEDQPPLLYPKVLLILLEETHLLQEIKHLRRNTSKPENMKFQEILRDLVKRKNTMLPIEEHPIEEPYLEKDISIGEITHSRVHTEDLMGDRKSSSLRKHSFEMTLSHTLTPALST